VKQGEDDKNKMQQELDEINKRLIKTAAEETEAQEHVSKLTTEKVIIRLKARLQPNSRNTVAHFDGVHAFGYNSTESEPVWMTSGLWSTVSTLSGAGSGRFWAQSTHLLRAGEPGKILFFFVW